MMSGTNVHPVEIARLRRAYFAEIPGEQRELDALSSLLEGCDRFIDVGANIGLYVHHANRILHGAEILAIEANPGLRPVLAETIEHACMESENGNSFAIETCAVQDEPGTIEFFIAASLDKSSLFAHREPGHAAVTVPARTLDEFYKPSRGTLIKMDIEGAEYRAMLSAGRFLSSGHTEFLVELHPWGDLKIKKYPLQVCALLAARGFACRRIYRHYHFFRAGLIRRYATLIILFPHLFLMWLPNRFRHLSRVVSPFHELLAKVRRKVLP